MESKKNKEQLIERVYGVHPVLEVLKAKRRKVYEVYVLKQEPKIWASIEPLLPKYKVIVHHLSKDALTEKVGTPDHQGVAMIVAPFPYRSTFFNPAREKFLVMLDGVQDVRNMGAIIRSAYCTGAQGVIVIRKNSSPLTAAAIKASAGLVESMEVYVATSVAQALVELKKAGYTIYVTALGGKQDAAQLTYTMPLCVVIGSEGRGVSSETLKAGTLVTLAQKTSDVSYNASVAAGIILFLIARQNTIV